MKTVSIEAVIYEGDKYDTVEVYAGEQIERRHVERSEYIEERMGRYHLAKQELRPMVERALDRNVR